MKIIKISVISLLFLSLMVPVFHSVKADVELPETVDEAKEMGNRTVEAIENELPSLIKSTWQNEVWPIWKSAYQWFLDHVWNNWLGSKVSNLWESAKRIFTNEVEERTPNVEQEFKTEKEEIKTETPTVLKSLWEKILEFVQ
jgi:hypothetical protein